MTAKAVNPEVNPGEPMEVTASGGTAPYTYTWQHAPRDIYEYDLDGARYVTEKTYDPIEGDASFTPEISAENAGVWYCTVKDTNGKSDKVTFTVIAPEISLQRFPEDGIADSGDELRVEVSGGTAPYTYRWEKELGYNKYELLYGGDTYSHAVDWSSDDEVITCTVTDKYGFKQTTAFCVNNPYTITKNLEEHYDYDGSSLLLSIETDRPGASPYYPKFQWQKWLDGQWRTCAETDGSQAYEYNSAYAVYGANGPGAYRCVAELKHWSVAYRTFDYGDTFKEEFDYTVRVISNVALVGDTEAPPPEAYEGTTPLTKAYTVTLDAIDSTQSVAAIKAVRDALGITLAEAQALVESAPCALITDADEEKAQEIKAALEAVGATVTVKETGSTSSDPDPEKDTYTVTLTAIDEEQKMATIKEIKELLETTLAEAKAFTDNVPSVLAEDVPKERAEEIKAALEALGATVTLS
ncbi:MAG: ribosomal protein L7/L12 [Oscillospiraceae bacterium]|nr:ribosomal protein L7/L12 [Oscillospiraceae bacterium]